jgi:uncharacterized protein (TIGR03086 family)
MASTAELFALVNEGFRARLHGLSPDQLQSPTPCEGWTALDCVDHVLGIYYSIVNATETDLVDDPTLTPLERFNRVAPVLEALVDNEEAASTLVEGPFGPLPLKQLVSSVVLSDTLVHIWDVAVATGGDKSLDAGLVERAFSKMAPMDEGLRGPGLFGPKREAPEGADLQTQFLCFLGRPAGDHQ